MILRPVERSCAGIWSELRCVIPLRSSRSLCLVSVLVSLSAVGVVSTGETVGVLGIGLVRGVPLRFAGVLGSSRQLPGSSGEFGEFSPVPLGSLPWKRSSLPLSVAVRSPRNRSEASPEPPSRVPSQSRSGYAVVTRRMPKRSRNVTARSQSA